LALAAKPYAAFFPLGFYLLVPIKEFFFMSDLVTIEQVTFDSLLSCVPIVRALQQKGYVHPTPIQAQAIPVILEGRDVFGIAQTGTGKTGAFALPVLQRLAEQANGVKTSVEELPTPAMAARLQSGARRTRSPLPRCLVLTPTRELCVQVAESFKSYGKGLPFRVCMVFGGVGEMPQKDALRRGVEIVVATPGRLLDLLMQGVFSLDGVEVLILDEADRMLDMGFLPDVKRIVSRVPAQRQTLLFSATLPDPIREISEAWLKNPARIEVAPVSSTPERIAQTVYHIDKHSKPQLLRHLIEGDNLKKVLVFSRTKHGADRIAEALVKRRIVADAIHGNKSQNARQRALLSFRDGHLRVLVATDLAARGIDVKGIDLVVNFDLPNEPETYVHRIGRTARAGAEGRALSFCSREERGFLRAIERLMRMRIDEVAVPQGLEVVAPLPELEEGAEEGDEGRSSAAPSRGGYPAPSRRPAYAGGRPSQEGESRGYQGGSRGGYAGGNREGGYSSGPAREGGYRGQSSGESRGGYGAPRGDSGPRNYGAPSERSNAAYGESQPRNYGEGGDRPARPYGDNNERPQRSYGDRPQRSSGEGSHRPYEPRGGQSSQGGQGYQGGGNQGGGYQGGSQGGSQGSRPYRGDRSGGYEQRGPRTESRGGYNRRESAPAAPSGEKPTIHHENKTPFWKRAFGNFTPQK